MKIETGRGGVTLTDVYLGVTLKTRDVDKMIKRNKLPKRKFR